MGNNYCKQLGISPMHPISTQDLRDVWSAYPSFIQIKPFVTFEKDRYVDKDDDYLGALTPETARTFVLDFAEGFYLTFLIFF
jgi:hypothetical protein